MTTFLETEYETCIDLIKYYDERQYSLMQYSGALSSGMGAVILALYELGTPVSDFFWPLSAFLGGMTTLALIALFVGMTQTRLYFVYPVRQANALRKKLLLGPPLSFSENQMYTTTDVPADRRRSAHFVLMAITALQAGGFLSYVLFALLFGTVGASALLFWCSVVALAVTFFLLFLSSQYLSSRSALSADHPSGRGSPFPPS